MFDKFVNDNNIFKDKMANSTINSYRQTNYKPQQRYCVEQQNIIISASFDKTLKKQ